MTITPEQLKEWQAVCGAATQGPYGIPVNANRLMDVALIAMPALIAEVRRLQVKHHADCAWWLCDGAGTADDMHGPHCTHPRQACDRDCASSVPGKEQA